MSFKAQSVSNFRDFYVKKSDAPLTIPKGPRLVTSTRNTDRDDSENCNPNESRRHDTMVVIPMELGNEDGFLDFNFA
jgi:hypothetical protein